MTKKAAHQKVDDAKSTRSTASKKPISKGKPVKTQNGAKKSSGDAKGKAGPTLVIHNVDFDKIPKHLRVINE